MNGLEHIEFERNRQLEKLGFDASHDDEHQGGELAIAAAQYALPHKKRNLITVKVTLGFDEFMNTRGGSRIQAFRVPKAWPFEHEAWKPTEEDRIHELARAGALIAAEIDRLQRVVK